MKYPKNVLFQGEPKQVKIFFAGIPGMPFLCSFLDPKKSSKCILDSCPFNMGFTIHPFPAQVHGSRMIISKFAKLQFCISVSERKIVVVTPNSLKACCRDRLTISSPTCLHLYQKMHKHNLH
jgi:hypothetical protein